MKRRSEPGDDIKSTHNRAKALVSRSSLDDDALKELESIRKRVASIKPPHRFFTADGYTPYPDVEDALFQQKIGRKKEFVQHRLTPVTLDTRNAAGVDAAWATACQTRAFRLTPTQLFLKTFMAPDTPYNSLLLFHGVGVGKTCSAITISEGFPRRKTLVLLNPALQDNFKKEIFDVSSLKRDADGRVDFSNMSQCTGHTYINRIRDKELLTLEAIERKITRLINAKYTFMGPRQFAHYVKRLGDGKTAIDNLRRKFSGTLIIVDEAHHLRTHGSSGSTNTDLASNNADSADSPNDEPNNSSTEKLFTPALRRVLKYCDDVKLLMLTATPMFNDARDVIELINLMLINDKRPTLRVADVFDKDGKLTHQGKGKLQDACRGYISYMRGENPFSFPFRLNPSDSRDKNAMHSSSFPLNDFRGQKIPPADRIKDLEICASSMSAYQQHVLDTFEASLASKDIKDSITDDDVDDPLFDGDNVRRTQPASILHSGLEICNIVFPATISTVRHGKDAFLNCFDIASQKPLQFAYRPKVPRFLESTTLKTYAPKMDTIIKRILAADGIVFVYSRFLWMGLIPLAIALEHAGFQRFNGKPMLTGAPSSSSKPGQRKKWTYIFLCGMTDITPNATYDIDAARAPENVDGDVIKVILASDFATEGIDLRFVREVHVMDPWYHMNKVEQIVGRACRYCSHAALPLAKRNTTLYLHASVRPRKETVDLYAYRIAQSKFERTRDVEDVLVSSAVDCSLNKARLYFNRDKINVTMQVETSQKVKIGYRVGDDPARRTEPKCVGGESVEVAAADDSTFDLRRHAHGIDDYIAVIKDIFAGPTVQATFEQLVAMRPADLGNTDLLIIALDEMLVNRTRIDKTAQDDTTHPGYLVYRGDMYLFQPTSLHVSATLEERSSRSLSSSTGKQNKLLIQIEPPISTSTTTLATPLKASSGTKLGHISRGRSVGSARTASSSTATKSGTTKHSTAINQRQAVKWNPANVLESIQKRVAQLMARLPLNHVDHYRGEIIDMIVDRLKIHQLLDTCGFVIQSATNKNPDVPLIKKSIVTGLLLLTHQHQQKHFAYDPLMRSFYVTRNRGRSWTPCQAVDLQEAMTLRANGLELVLPKQKNNNNNNNGIAGYVAQTTKPTPSGVLFKIIGSQTGAAGCVCHQTSSVTVSAIIKLINKLNANMIDINKQTDKRSLCELYELALRKHQPRKILRPAIPPPSTMKKSLSGF